MKTPQPAPPSNDEMLARLIREIAAPRDRGILDSLHLASQRLLRRNDARSDALGNILQIVVAAWFSQEGDLDHMYTCLCGYIAARDEDERKLIA